MLQLLFSLVEDEGDDDTWNESESDGEHKDVVKCPGSLLSCLESVEDWEWSSRDVEGEVWVACGSLKDGLVHPLRVKGGNILTCDVQVVVNLPLLGDVVSLENLVRSISVWEQWLFIPELIELIIHLEVIRGVGPIDLKVSLVWEVVPQSGHWQVVCLVLNCGPLVQNHSLLWVERGAEELWRRLVELTWPR